MRISDWSSDVCSSNLVAPDDVDQRHRGVDHGVHRLEPALSCEIVGILPVGRRSEAQALPGLHDGKRTHGSAYSSLPAGIVAIEAHRSDEHLVGEEWVSTCRSEWAPYHYK